MRVVDSQTVVQPGGVVTFKDGRKGAGLNLGFVEKPEVGTSELGHADDVTSLHQCDGPLLLMSLLVTVCSVVVKGKLRNMGRWALHNSQCVYMQSIMALSS